MKKQLFLLATTLLLISITGKVKAQQGTSCDNPIMVTVSNNIPVSHSAEFKEQWYSVIITQSGYYTATNCGQTSIPTTLAIYKDSCLGAEIQTQITICNESSTGKTYTFYAEMGKRYYFKWKSVSVQACEYHWDLVQEEQNYDSLTINNVRALIKPSNQQFHMGRTPINGYRYPANDLTSTIFSYALWMGGKTTNDELVLAAEQFHDDVKDFQQGPINVIGNTYSSDEETLIKWNRTWKLSAAEIQEFVNALKTNGTIDTNMVPESIKTWPAHGDITKGQLQNIAPFFDNDGDGKYNWKKGDYPLIKGDQCIFFVINDACTHTESGGQPMNIEMHIMAYAFGDETDSAFWNSMFFNYTIYNRSQNNYTNVSTGAWCDFDIGYFSDDYIGCDVKQGIFYGYNGKAVDGPGDNSYTGNPPAQGVAILGGAYMDNDGKDNPKIDIEKMKILYPSQLFNYVLRDSITGQVALNPQGDTIYDTVRITNNAELFYNPEAGGAWYFKPDDFLGNCAINGTNFGNGIVDDERLGMRRFVYYNIGNSHNGDPTRAQDYYNYMNGLWKDNRRMTFGGNGYGGQIECDFMFPAKTDPWNWGTNGVVSAYVDARGWTEEAEMNLPGDRRGIAASGPFTFGANTSFQFDVALVAGIGDAGPYSSVEKMREYTQQIKTEFSLLPEKFKNQSYGNLPIPNIGIQTKQQPSKEKLLKIYPNPATSELHVQLALNEIVNYAIFNVMGQVVLQGKLHNSSILNIQPLAKGLYYLKIIEKENATVRFIKQ